MPLLDLFHRRRAKITSSKIHRGIKEIMIDIRTLAEDDDAGNVEAVSSTINKFSKIDVLGKFSIADTEFLVSSLNATLIKFNSKLGELKNIGESEDKINELNEVIGQVKVARTFAKKLAGLNKDVKIIIKDINSNKLNKKKLKKAKKDLYNTMELAEKLSKTINLQYFMIDKASSEYKLKV